MEKFQHYTCDKRLSKLYVCLGLNTRLTMLVERVWFVMVMGEVPRSASMTVAGLILYVVVVQLLSHV